MGKKYAVLLAGAAVIWAIDMIAGVEISMTLMLNATAFYSLGKIVGFVER